MKHSELRKIIREEIENFHVWDKRDKEFDSHLDKATHSNEIHISLKGYKEKVKSLIKNPEIFNDQMFYEDMVSAFQSGISPYNFVNYITQS